MNSFIPHEIIRALSEVSKIASVADQVRNTIGFAAYEQHCAITSHIDQIRKAERAYSLPPASFAQIGAAAELDFASRLAAFDALELGSAADRIGPRDLRQVAATFGAMPTAEEVHRQLDLQEPEQINLPDLTHIEPSNSYLHHGPQSRLAEALEDLADQIRLDREERTARNNSDEDS